MEAAVSVENLTVTYQTKPVLVDVSFQVTKGSVVGILGPNGAGKSTVIKSIMGFVPRDFGTVKIFNEKVKNARGRVAYVPQRGEIDWNFPVNVYDVVLMGRYGHLPWYKTIGKKDREIADQALADVRMQDFKDRQI